MWWLTLCLGSMLVAAATSSNVEPPTTSSLQQQPGKKTTHKSQIHPRKLQQQQQDDEEPSIAMMGQIRSAVLGSYDRGSYPFESQWKSDSSDNTRSGLPVEVGFNFHRVFSVDVTSSVADLVVWVRLQWKDPRLAWDPMQYQNVSTIFVWIGDGTGQGETSEIWTPDLELWNLESSLSDSLVDTHASVQSDGTVFWSRPGHVKPVCKFSGLNDFPFDTLTCVMEIGSWAYSGLYLRPIKMGEGYTIGGSNTAGEAYAEYSLKTVECQEFVYPPFIAAPEEDWPVLFYNVAFQRAWQPYARGYLVMQVILNLVAFCCFWLPPHVGERMGLSITSVLAAVASELVVASNLPAASEITWFAKFSLASLMFTALTLFESAVVIYLHYHTGDDLIPRYAKYLHRVFREYQQQGKNSSSLPGSETTTDTRKQHHQGTDKESSKESSTDFVVRSSGKRAVGNVSFEITTEADAANELDPSRAPSRLHDHNNDHDDDHDDTPPPFATIKPGLPHATPSQRHVMETILGRDADDYKNAREMQNNVRWQKLAAGMDEISRVVFPIAFAVYMGATFGAVR